jgi:5-methylcytosine-specific restriction endonuclease McrA
VSQFKNQEILQKIINRQNWNLVEKFMKEFQSKVDSTFICNTVLVENKTKTRCEFQIKDTKEKCIDFFGVHNKSHEFSLSFGKKYLTFYIRLNIEKFEEKKELTFLTITPTNYKNPPKEKSKREGYISKIKTPEDITELIDFIFFKCLSLFSEKKEKNNIKSKKQLQQEFENKIETGKLLSKEERIKKIMNYPKIPKKVIIKSYEYIRNPLVVIEALERANGKCEKCHKNAPFLRNKDSTPYLEVHHKIPLSQNGEDTLKNVLALCPNCHREEHFGKKKE